MATIIETDFTREDENEDISLIEEKLANLFKGYKPTFHPALEILRSYPISSLGISKDTKRELVRKYGYKDLYRLFTEPLPLLNTTLRKKSYNELKMAVVKFVHETDEILVLMSYCPILILICDMLSSSDKDIIWKDQ